jgi:molybdenum cofactor cytidylyltransferase
MERQLNVSGVILAAGESRRFGSPKQLAQLHGRSLLEHVLATAETAGLRPVVAVVPVWLTRPAALSGDWLRWVRNPFPERGLSHSLRLGFAVLPDEAEAAVILLGDQPTVTTTDIARLVAARGATPIVASRTDGHLAPPVLLERQRFSLVEEAAGDAGLRSLLEAHPDWVSVVETPDRRDIDTPADLDALSDG